MQRLRNPEECIARDTLPRPLNVRTKAHPQESAAAAVASLQLLAADAEDTIGTISKLVEDEKAEEKRQRGRDKYKLSKHTSKFKKTGLPKISKALASCCRDFEACWKGRVAWLDFLLVCLLGVAWS